MPTGSSQSFGHRVEAALAGRPSGILPAVPFTLIGWIGAGAIGVVVGCAEPQAPTADAPRPAAVAAAHEQAHGHEHGHDKGGGKHDDHDDHDHVHPETLAAGVAEIEKLWGHVKAALKSGDRDAADEKVHAAGHLLEDFEALVAKEKAELQEAGKKATQQVFDCFDTLDAALHGAEDELKKIDVEELGGRLENAFQALKELTGVRGPDANATR